MAPRKDDEERSPTSQRVTRALRRFSTESDLYAGAAGRGGEMHRTDLNGLALIMDWGFAGVPATPGRIGAALGLSAPATTALLDRLERAGHVTRAPHPDDRRSVVVSVTDHAMEVGGAMFSTLAAHVGTVLAQRTEAELELIADFLEQVAEATEAARRSLGQSP